MNCDLIRDNLARQTPVFDDVFLEDYISQQMTDEAFLGRHKTRTWTDGKQTLVRDKMHVMFPNFTQPWQQITGDGCANPCDPPRTSLGFGSTRSEVNFYQKDLQSQLFCLQQLRTVQHATEQFTDIFKVLSKIPRMFISEFLRTRFTSFHDTLQIAGAGFPTFTITSGNTDPNLTTINLGSAANLPQSTLTLPILNVYQQMLQQNGYNIKSGMPAGMINLVTHSLQYQQLVGANPALRGQLFSQNIKDLSPLYKVGVGINAEPFGIVMPTFDTQQVRFQHSGNGLLQRVYPYLNDVATTGEKPIPNPAWLTARYAISYILHPQAATLWTPAPRKIHAMVPSINTAMFGKWDYINPKGVLMYEAPDGTVCTKNNDQQFWFYWLAHMEAGFSYEQEELVFPILHLIDGIGANCIINNPVCGSAPSYVAQDYSSNPLVCE